MGELLQLLLKLAIVVHARFGLMLLRLALEEKLIDFAHGQTLSEIEERAVFVAPVMTVAIGFAALGKALNKGGPEEVGMNLEVFEEKFLALAQSQSGFAFKFEYPSHRQGEDTKTGRPNKQKRKCPTKKKLLGISLNP